MTKIPAHVAEGRSSPFPAGTYMGRLNEVKESWSEDKTNLTYNVWFKEVTALEGGREVGNRPFRQQLKIINNNESIVDIVEFNDQVPFMLSRSAGLIAQLALALNEAKVDPRTRDVTFDMETFLENLAQGVYKDRTLVFEVQNRSYKRRDGTMAVDDSAVRFASAEVQQPEIEQITSTPTGSNGHPQVEPAATLEIVKEPEAPSIEAPATAARSLRTRK